MQGESVGLDDCLIGLSEASKRSKISSSICNPLRSRKDKGMTMEADHFSNSVSWKLNDYEVDDDRGFLPAPDPLDRLPNDFSPWEEMGRELPKLLMSSK